MRSSCAHARVWSGRPREFLAACCTGFDRVVPLPLGASENRRSLIALWNLAASARECRSEHAAPVTRCFSPPTAKTYRLRELLRRLARSLGTRRAALANPARRRCASLATLAGARER